MAVQKVLTEAEYFRLDHASDSKLEPIDGQVVDVRAMAGGAYAHSLVSANLVRLLGNALEGRPCRAHGSELRVGMPKSKSVYPDALVECGKPALREEGPSDTILNPIAVYEVMSPSSIRYDMEPKRDAYAETPTVQEIVLVHLDAPRIDRYVRFDGGWRWEATVGVGSILRTIDAEISLSAIYAGVEFRPEP